VLRIVCRVSLSCWENSTGYSFDAKRKDLGSDYLDGFFPVWEDLKASMEVHNGRG